MSDNIPSSTVDATSVDLLCWRLRAAWLAWRNDEPTPRWQDYLPPPEESDSSELIFRLVQTDIAGRIQAGLPALLSERYFEHPRWQMEPRLDGRRQGELILWEYQQRWQSGQQPGRRDYQVAFPGHASVLEETAPVLSNPSCASETPASTPPPLTGAERRISSSPLSGLDLRGYKLSERLGGGGMGDVYRADDPALGRDLAVKVMKAELQGYAAAEQRFLREARVTGSLQHPGIVPIHNLGRLADGRLHYTMRLVRGRTFAEILREDAGKPERLPMLLSIFEKVCQAVAYAHSKQVIHRDLKPANVMVGRFGEVQVMDWGLAKVLTGEEEADGEAEGEGTRIPIEAGETPVDLTHLGREMGTPAFMPPEQALGEWDTVDQRADVFALGALLCEILTGRPAYTGGGLEALRKAKRGDLTEALVRLEECGADAALLELCRDCLAPAKENRPQDAEQIAQRVAAYQAEVQERLRQAELERASALVKAREERKKRRWMWAAVALLLAGAAGSTWQAVRATKAEGEAKENEGRALTAAEKEQEANTLAQNRFRQIEKANGVLSAVFHDLDPAAEEKGGPGIQQQLSQHMQRAARQLEEAAVGDAVAAARLQTTLGHSLINLGQLPLAIEVLTKAVRTLESQLADDDPATLLARNNLAQAYHRDGQDAEAIRLHTKTLKQYEAKLGYDDAQTLVSRNNLAVAYLSDDRTTEATRLLEQVLQQRQAKLGADDLNTVDSCNNLAMAYESAGRTTEAIRLHEQALQQYEARLGPVHYGTITSRINLAVAYLSDGRTTEAIHLLEQTVKRADTKLGPDHPNTLKALNGLGQAYRDAGRYTEAVRLHEKGLTLAEDKLGTDHPTTLKALNGLGMAYRDAGRYTEAVRLNEKTLKLAEAKLGPDHPSTLVYRNNLALVYVSLGRIAEAIRLHEQALKPMEAKRGLDHPTTLKVRDGLASAYLDAGRTADAIRLKEQILEQRKAKLGPDHPTTLNSRNGLALTYWKADRAADAIHLLEPTLKQQETQLGPDHPDTSASRNNLALAYRSAGRMNEAIRLHQQDLKRNETKLGFDHPHTLLSMANLGGTYLFAGRLNDAIPMLETAIERGRKRPDGFPVAIEWASGALANAYDRSKQFAKAEAVHRDSLERIQQKFGPDDPQTANAMAWLAWNLLQQKKYTEAEGVLRPALTIEEQKEPDVWTTFNTQSLLGAALMGQTKYAEAEPLLLQGYMGLKQRQDKIPAAFRRIRLTIAQNRLVQLYEALGKKEEAAKWRSRESNGKSPQLENKK